MVTYLLIVYHTKHDQKTLRICIELLREKKLHD